MGYGKTRSADADADLERAWAALAAVVTWPQWTRSMNTVEPLDDAELRVGNRFRIRQPGLPALVWRITAVREGESFTWEARSPGVRSVAFHGLRENPDGTTQITIGIEQSGPLSGLIRALTGAKTGRYLEMEAAGLTAASEDAMIRGEA